MHAPSDVGIEAVPLEWSTLRSGGNRPFILVLAGMTTVIRQIEYGSHIADLLSTCGLPTDDVSGNGRVTFYGTEPAPSHGVVALEEAGSAALLRSLALASEFRGQGLGTALVAHAEAAAASCGD